MHWNSLFFRWKIKKKFWGGGTAPLPSGEGEHPLPTPHPLGASILAPTARGPRRLRRLVLAPPRSEILDPPLLALQPQRVKLRLNSNCLSEYHFIRLKSFQMLSFTSLTTLAKYLDEHWLQQCDMFSWRRHSTDEWKHNLTSVWYSKLTPYINTSVLYRLTV